MGAGNKRKPATAIEVSAEVLDRRHLARYTMENLELEREIVALFLQQLPSTLNLLKAASSAADWKLAAHTLKGSAAAVGAMEINCLAMELETRSFAIGANGPLISQVERAVARFEEFCRQTFC
jgi:HPt (histidine-containing phosphotransfer) domain-containing protein